MIIFVESQKQMSSTTFNWPVECGSLLVNPYCLLGYPTDPYSWYFYQDEYKQAFPWNASKSYPIDSGATYNGLTYICTASGCNTAPPSNTVGDPWTLLSSLVSPQNRPLECDRVGGPVPNPESGVCEKSPLNGPEAACVNPCIRLSSGILAVNKNAQQCRVFPNATDGGNATTVIGPTGAITTCPTVCPSACVEFWESCPPGTAPLTTLIQTKTPDDLMSLTGPYKADNGLYPEPSYNKLWPTNYSRYVNGLPPIGGKPYTECYSYNTEFCELPMARQETVSGPDPRSPLGLFQNPITVCYSQCPAGTFQDPADPYTCLFVPLSGVFNPLNPFSYGPETPVQKVFCNPQYFNPAYWDATQHPNFAGTQKGCTAKPLPAKQGSTCPSGTSPIINENFNLEWCLPDCKTGYVADLTQSSCIATCQGAFATASGIPTENAKSTTAYNKFLDYVDFYAQAYRCIEETYTSGNSTVNVEVDCIQNYTSGRCPAQQKDASNDDVYKFDIVDISATNPFDVLTKYSSINKQCVSKLYRDYIQSSGTSGIPKSQFDAYISFLEKVKKYQDIHTNGPNKLSKWYTLEDSYVECPANMEQGSALCQENNALCYDICIDGYEPVTYCRNGASTCDPANTVYACRALCPSENEGLGPWKPVTLPNGVFACEYQYPNGVPTNPNFWETCPEDGRYIILQTDLSTGATTTQGAADRKPPLCVRDTFLRQITCPNGFTEVFDSATGLTSCQRACSEGDLTLTLDSGKVVCQNVQIQNSRYQYDLTAGADYEATKVEFRPRVMRRLNYARGIGLDPNIGITNPSTPTESPWLSWLKYIGYIILGIILFTILKLVFFPGKKGNTTQSNM